MTPYSYRELKPRICRMCGSNFMSGHPNAAYCTLKCQRRAASLRRRGRETVAVDLRFHMTIRDPSVAQLNSAARDIILEMNEDKPIKVFGIVPRWTPPKGVDLVEQHDDEGSFLMDKHVPDIMEIFNNELAKTTSPQT